MSFVIYFIYFHRLGIELVIYESEPEPEMCEKVYCFYSSLRSPLSHELLLRAETHTSETDREREREKKRKKERQRAERPPNK